MIGQNNFKFVPLYGKGIHTKGHTKVFSTTLLNTLENYNERCRKLAFFFIYYENFINR